MRHFCRLAVTCVLALLASPVAATTLEAVVAGGYGRLAFDAAAPETLSSRWTGGVLEIEASEPFPAKVESLVERLAPLLAASTLDDQGHVLRLHPADGVVVEAVDLDQHAVRVGLYTPDAPLLRLRLGRHDGFRRVVLEPVDRRFVRLARDGERLTLVLPGRLAQQDRQRLAAVPGLAGVAMAGDQLFLTLAPGTAVRDHFVGPDRQVLDISVGSAGIATSAVGAVRVLSPGAAVPRPRARPGAAPLGIERFASPDRSAAAEPPLPDWPTLSDAVPPGPAPDTLTIDAIEAGAGAIEVRFAWAVPVPAAVFVRGNQLWVAFAAKSRSLDLEPAAFTRTARRLVRAVRQEPHATATLFQLSLNDAVVTGVDRDGGQWRVRLAAAGLADALPAAPPTLRIEETDEGIRLPDIDAVLSFRDPVVGDRLAIGLAEAPTGASWTARRFVGLRLLPALQGAVWQKLVEGGRLPRVAADGLVLGPRDGVLRTNPGIEAPATALLAPRPVGPDEGLLEQAAPESLPPSPIADASPPDDPPPPPRQMPSTASITAESAPYEDSAVAGAPARGDDDAGDDREPDQPRRPGPLGLWRFAGTPDRPYWELRAELLQAANRAEVGERQAVQLDLARLHVANGLGAEAVSLLAGMLEPFAGDGGGEARPAYRALDGAALLLAGRHDEALARLADAALSADDETALWRGAARAALHDWDAALADWRRGEAHLAAYPPLAQAALAEHGVMLLLQTGQIDEAFGLLERLGALPLPQARRDRLRLLEATALERDGALDEARVVWRALATEGAAEPRAQAYRALVDSDLEAGRITVAEAAGRLAVASVAWRGLGQESGLRRRLAALHHAAGQAEVAMAMLQDTLARDPPAPLASAIAGDMAAIVEDLFAAFEAGRRGAIATLLTYRRFAELVPSGSSGDARVVSLASALDRLGLDEAASEVLRGRLQQGDVRDEGRARLGLALAELLARRSDPRGAIAALLDSTPLDALGPSVAAARRELMAGLGQAGDRQAGDESVAVDQQLTLLRERARAAFAREAWHEVVAAGPPFEALLPATGPLDRASAELLLMVATAARRVADDALLERLAGRYADRLAVADDRAVLQLLATPSRFGATPEEIVTDAARHAKRLRDAIRPEPGA